LVITATTVTPEIDLVVFLRKTANNLGLSWGVSAAMMSAFEGISSKWYLAAVASLNR
jgi:hypothetical protein